MLCFAKTWVKKWALSMYLKTGGQMRNTKTKKEHALRKAQLRHMWVSEGRRLVAQREWINLQTVSQSFLSFFSWCSWSVNHPKGGLAKFGYKQDMKVKKFKHPSYFWLHAGTQ
jgi:hypothetical protein